MREKERKYTHTHIKTYCDQITINISIFVCPASSIEKQSIILRVCRNPIENFYLSME